MEVQADALDQYFNKIDVVRIYLNELDNISKYDRGGELSASNGVFLEAMNLKNKDGLDIDPQHKGVLGTVRFEYDAPDRYKQVLIVGNPPYGYYRLSSAFIRRTMSFETFGEPMEVSWWIRLNSPAHSILGMAWRGNVRATLSSYMHPFRKITYSFRTSVITGAH